MQLQNCESGVTETILAGGFQQMDWTVEGAQEVVSPNDDLAWIELDGGTKTNWWK